MSKSAMKIGSLVPLLAGKPIRTIDSPCFSKPSTTHGSYLSFIYALAGTRRLAASVLEANSLKVSRYYPVPWPETYRTSLEQSDENTVSTRVSDPHGITDPDIQVISSGSVYDGYDNIPKPGAGDYHLYTDPNTWVADFGSFDNVETPHLIGEMASTFPNGGSGWGSGILRPFPWYVVPGSE